jgi:UDP-N-acetyl-D-mannosaminuronic acid transferase (WecB/TagA/CpsF family)
MTNQHEVITPVLGTGLLATTYEGLSRRLLDKLRDGEGALAVDFANTHIVTMRRHDPEFTILSKCIDTTVPDGMPTFSAAMPS